MDTLPGLRIWGLRTCDTCRGAAKALESKGFRVAFRDIRQEPLDGSEIDWLLGKFGPEVVNTRSTTWRALDDDARLSPPDQLLSSYPALMKRPVIISGDQATLGWSKSVQISYLA